MNPVLLSHPLQTRTAPARTGTGALRLLICAALACSLASFAADCRATVTVAEPAGDAEAAFLTDLKTTLVAVTSELEPLDEQPYELRSTATTREGGLTLAIEIVPAGGAQPVAREARDVTPASALAQARAMVRAEWKLLHPPPAAAAPAPGIRLRAAPDLASLAPSLPCDLTVPRGPTACPRDVQRRWRRHLGELRELEKVMAREGQDFSERRLRGYRLRIGVGIPLIVVGAGAMAFAAVFGINAAVARSHEDDEPDVDDDFDDTEYGSISYEPHDLGPEGTGVACFLGGLTSVAVGALLVASGILGKNRQNYLRRKDEIRAPFDPFAGGVSFLPDADRGGGRLVLRVAF